MRQRGEKEAADMAHGHIAHMEIPSDDLERTSTFYGGVFAWQIGPVDGFPDYEMVSTGQEGLGGAIGLRGKTAPDALRIYVNVDSIEAALAKVADLGGSVIVERTEVPGMGRYAAVKGPQVNEMGLWEDPPA
jgi:predicted enzyme related to lactoylglutathione lyase